MKMRFKRSLSILLALTLVCLICACAPLTAYAEDSDAYSVTGTCGKVNAADINWFAFSDRTMVFLGTGAMQDYSIAASGNSTAPWFGDDMTIISSTLFSTKIVVESGVTTIGDYAFYLSPLYATYTTKMFMTISSIDLSDTVTSIGDYAFYRQGIENINIPPTVTHIGTHAFGQCNDLESINYYGDPAQLTWDHDGEEAEFTVTGNKMTCHILSSYTNAQTAAFNDLERFKSIGLEFVNDLNNPYETAEDGIDRNIALYYGATNSKVFAGAAPFIVVGKFNGNKKSTTFGSNGFVSCVKKGDTYYLLTDHNGTLSQATVDSNGKATATGAADSGLKLTLRHEYIGGDIVKVIYSLKNESGAAVSGIKLGSSGDIKIGADDRAAVDPLMNGANQVGFYMSSTKAFDQSGDEYATLGFVASNINNPATGDPYPAASFFYGKVGANVTNTAAGTRDKHVFPVRIFEPNATGSSASNEYWSYSNTEYPSGHDAGMSYHWDDISLDNNETKEYVVLYSIYGGSTRDGTKMVADMTSPHYTVTWQNYDETTVLQKQSVRNTLNPAYSGVTPTKPSDKDYHYRFIGWTDGTNNYGPNELPAVSGDVTYTARFEAVTRPFYASHSLSLNGDIAVNFYVDVETIEGLTVDSVRGGSKIVTMDFRWFDKHSQYTISSDDYDAGLGLFKATCNVAAAEMMFPITATVYVRDSGAAAPGTLQSGDKFTERYRIRDYADVILDPASAFSAAYAAKYPERYTALVDLIKKMLDYGAKSQVVFDRYRDKDGASIAAANSGVSYTMTPHAIDAGTPDMETDLSTIGLEYAGSTLTLETTTTLSHYYIVRNRTAFDAVKESANVDYHVNGSYICFEWSNIAAKDLDVPQVFTIGSLSYSYSAIQFAQRMQVYNRPGEYDLATALYWYNDAAKAYFALLS